LTALTDVPVWVICAFQPEVICWLPVKVQLSVQLVTGEPVFVSVTFAVNPPDHWLTW
jgi:hypothetical protein